MELQRAGAALVSAPATANSLPVTEVGTFEQYDVFLCHRGSDTKFGFASYLSERLEGAGLRPFLDYKSIVHGHDSQACMDSAVKTTPIALVIFSEKFVDSEWCLNELDELMSLIDDRRVKVIPVFYKVKPDQVCFREGSEEFKELERKHGGSIDRWKRALVKARNMCGREYLGQRSEPELVKAIVREVSELANKPLPLAVGDYVFGTKKVVDEIIQKHMGVSILLLWGTGGMGKSTLARELYNRLKDKTEENSLENFFTASCHVEVSSKDEVEVQTQILEKLCPNAGDLKFGSKDQGKTELESRLSKKRILMVLDDVPDNRYLYYWISKMMLTKGSMCIVTCRNRDVVEKLNKFDLEKEVHFHAVQGLGSEDSEYVFGSYAFDGHWNVKTGFEELVAKISEACRGVPLVLQVCGALLKGNEDVALWDEVLKKLIEGGTHKILGRVKFEQLKISFDALPGECQEMFLDITCALLGEPKDMAILAWKSHDWSPRFGIHVLVQRALVTVDSFGRFQTHNLLRDMGRQIIVEQRSKRGITRLSMPESLERLRENEEFPESLELLIIYSVSDRDLQRALDISHMKRLRILMCDDTITATSIPKSLCWWNLYEPWFKRSDSPSFEQLVTPLPTPLPDNKLVVLSLARSRIEMLPDNVGILKNLEVLNLRGCKKLCRLPDSFVGLRKLRHLNLEGSGITSLPTLLGDLSSLEVLNVRGCGELHLLPDSFVGLKKLRDLNLEGTGIRSLPASFGDLSNLEVLNLRGCKLLWLLPELFGGLGKLRELNLEGSGIRSLPTSFWELSNLEVLNLRGCKKLWLLPDSFGGLTKLGALNMEGSGVTSLPASFGHLSSLEVLNVRGCGELHLLPDSFVGLKKLRDLNLEGSGIRSLPASFEDLGSLEVLNLRGCENLLLLPGSLTGLTNLKEFGYSGSAFASLLQTMGKLREFEESSLSSKLNTLQDLLRIMKTQKELVLENFAVEALPESFGELGNLEVLNLRGCRKLFQLPDSFGGLTKLGALNLEGSGITSLPAPFGHLSSLEVLNVRGCGELHLLPDSFVGLKKLRDLNLEGSGITSLPASFWELSNLEVLNLRECSKLCLLPDSFGGLRKLRELNLEGSGITSLPALFWELSNLEVLNLRECSKLFLLPDSFGGLRKLRDLNLGGSGITGLPLFWEFSNLEVLNLRECSMLWRLPEWFGGLTKLRDLNLEGSGITSLPKSFGELTNLEVLNLGEPESFCGISGEYLLGDLTLNDLGKLRELIIDGNSLDVKEKREESELPTDASASAFWREGCRRNAFLWCGMMFLTIVTSIIGSRR